MGETSFGLISTGGPFRLGGCDIDPASCRIRNGSLVIKLQPQAVSVLAYLAARPGQVISRDEIESVVWEGRTVGYDALTGTMFKLRKALGDNPKDPRIIETISKRGYRLLVGPQPAAEPFYALAMPDDHPLVAPQPETESHAPGAEAANRSLAALWQTMAAPGGAGGHSLQNLVARLKGLGFGSWAALAAFLIVLAAAIVQYSTPIRAPPAAAPAAAKKSVVVLPFRLLGEPKTGDYLADGLTDDLTTVLATRSDLLVIARDSAFVYKGQEVTDAELGTRLSVDYVLRGTVRRDDSDVRINARLIDTAKGEHVWAEQFHGDAARLLGLEDEIARRILNALLGHIAPQSPQAAPTVAPPTLSLEAYDAFLAGRQHFYTYLNKKENEKARTLFEQALQFDPNFARADAMLAWTYAFDAMNGWSKDRAASLQMALEIAEKAKAINKDIPLTYFVTGLAYREQKEYVKALVEAEKAIALDPNDANSHVLVATLLYYAGRPEESIAPLKKAIRLNPHHPFTYLFHLGQAYYVLRRYDDAVKVFRDGLAKNPAAERLHVWLAAALAQAGRTQDAKWEVEQVLVLNPDFNPSTNAEAFPFKDKADADHFMEGLRKAGFF